MFLAGLVQTRVSTAQVPYGGHQPDKNTLARLVLAFSGMFAV